jgi:hypothetical protein
MVADVPPRMVSSVGGYDVNAGALGVLVGQATAFTFIPALGAVPIGLNNLKA